MRAPRKQEDARWSTVIAFVCLVVAKVFTLRGSSRANRRDDAPIEVETLAHDRTEVPPFDAAAAGVAGSGGPKGWLLRFAERRRWRWAGRALQVQQRYSEVRGNDLAASVTLVAFLSLFPLALVAIAVAGFLQADSSDFAERLIDNLGLTGDAADQLETALDRAASSRRATSIIGVVGLLWAGLGFTGALRLAYNTTWQVPDRGLKDKAIGLGWLAGAAVLFAGGAAVTVATRLLPAFTGPLAIVVAFALSFGFFLWTSHVLPNIRVGLRPLVPGALIGGVGLIILQAIGALLVPRMVASASALYGSLGVVFATLAWLLFFGRLVVYSAVIDVVLYEARAGTMVSVVEVPRHEGATRAVTRAGTTRPTARPATEVDEESVAIVQRPGPA